MKKLFIYSILMLIISLSSCQPPEKEQLIRVKYNNPGLVVDLGVGLWAWPIPMDYDKDGDYDLLVNCPDKPNNGIYFFENIEGDAKMPVFKPGVRLANAHRNIMPSYINDQVHILIAGKELTEFTNFTESRDIYKTDNIHENKVRANQWRYCDLNGDGNTDIIVGVGDWTEYGWDNAFDKNGKWTRGPLHGYVYWLENKGSDKEPNYAEPVKLKADGKEIDVYGMPSPNFADFDNDGDLDLMCGEFLDRLTYFENIGSKTEPKFAPGRFLTADQQVIKMDLEMIIPVAIDWDKDGDTDLIVGEEDGRVAFLEHTGQVVAGLPQFKKPLFFQQQADELKFGALVTPWSVDWDSDGDEDLICGNTAGYIGFIENLDGGNPPKWAKPKYLEADGEIIRIQAGYNGSIQGPCEAKWGYTTLSVADWDQDGLLDIIVNSIWGKVVWYKNIGTQDNPQLAAAQPILVESEDGPQKPEWFWWNPVGKELATQWRTTPVVIDLNKDGLNDLVMLDYEGYPAFFERIKKDNQLLLLPPKRIFKSQTASVYDRGGRIVDEKPGVLQLNDGQAGKSGRRKLCFTDWNGDGKLDLLINSKNINVLINTAENGNEFIFKDIGPVSDHVLAGHTTSPTVVDWDKNGIPDLLIGAEGGFFYYIKNNYPQ